MSNKQIRTTIRIVHLIASALLIALVYSGALRASAEYVTFMKFVVIPVIAASGIGMWQQATISRLRRRTATS